MIDARSDPNFEVLTGEEILERYREFGIEAEPVAIDLSEVPRGLWHLVPLARLWGVGDDVLREKMRHAADPASLKKLKRLVSTADRAFDEWLTSPEALASGPTTAYVAFSNLRMVADAID